MKNISLFLFFVFVALFVSAQTEFSGTWKLNKTKSVLNKEFTMAPGVLIIKQAENDFMVERHASFQGNEFTVNDRFTLDVTECINDGWGDSKKKSTAVWDENKNILSITTKFPMHDGGEMVINEHYLFDGKCLVIKMEASSSYGVVEEKQVFEQE